MGCFVKLTVKLHRVQLLISDKLIINKDQMMCNLMANKANRTSNFNHLDQHSMMQTKGAKGAQMLTNLRQC
jgi:hypothetical protein